MAEAASESVQNETQKPTEPAKPAPPPKIQVDAAEYASLYQAKTTLDARVAAFEAEKQAAIEAANKKHIEELAQSKGIAAALEEQARQAGEKLTAAEKRAIDIQSRWLGEKRDNAIMAAIGNTAFVNEHARKDAIAKLQARIDVSLDGENVIVRDRGTGRFAGDAIPELLSGEEFAHLLAPKSRGGSGAQGGNQSSSQSNQNQVNPAVSLMQERRSSGRTFGLSVVG